jgi:septal ring factor EnvC (AmiA/AmiB activator)
MGSSAAYRYYARSILAKQGLRRGSVEPISNMTLNVMASTKPQSTPLAVVAAATNLADEQLCDIAYSHSQADSSRFSTLWGTMNARMAQQLNMSQNQLKRMPQQKQHRQQEGNSLSSFRSPLASSWTDAPLRDMAA